MTWLHWIGIGSIFGGLGVGLGAFAAHGLRRSLESRELDIFETAVRYQMYHALAIIAVGLVMARLDSDLLRYSAVAFTFGVLVFSGSLYFLVLSGQRWLGAVTPIGGVGLIAGWLLMAIAVWRH